MGAGDKGYETMGAGKEAQSSFTLQQFSWSKGYAMNNQNEPLSIHPAGKEGQEGGIVIKAQ